MEPNLLSELIAFIKKAYTTYIRQALTGAGLVGFTVWPLFFNPIPHELRATWIGVWAVVKTLMSAYLGSLATALGTYHVDLYKTKRNGKPKGPKKERKKAA